MERDMNKICDGLIKYLNYKLDQIENGTYPDKILFHEVKKFYDREVVALLTMRRKTELNDLGERFKVLG